MPSYTALPIILPTNSNKCKWLSVKWEAGDGYKRSSLVAQNKFKPGSNTLLTVSSKNSLKTPSWSMPASSRP